MVAEEVQCERSVSDYVIISYDNLSGDSGNYKRPKSKFAVWSIGVVLRG